MSVTYRPGDVVWVKLRPHWWPAEVIDKSQLPESFIPKKDPIAFVGFFEEESFECIKNENHIKFYNCSKKNEFIKKGMDAYRAKQPNMETFPKQVCTAETLTEGNPNILSDPEFSPQKKINYAAELFGTPSVKKTGTPGRRSKGHSSPKKKSAQAGSSRTSEVGVTHRRFLGYDDHEVRILIQTPKSDEQQEEAKKYECPKCEFKTPRIEVFMMHKKSHIQGVYTPTRVPIKKPKRASKIPRTKTLTIDEDIALLEKGLPLTADPSELDSEDETPKVPSPKPKAKAVVKAKPPPQPKAKPIEVEADIAKSILSQWDDDGSDEEENATNDSKVETNTSTAKPETVKQNDKSCFDFTEDDDNEPVTTTGKRKIPRVIPVSEKSKSNADAFDSLISSVSPKPETTAAKEPKLDENASKKPDIDDSDIMDLLESTTVPTLPELPNLLKCEQNFPDAKTIKFPDKPGVQESPTSSQPPGNAEKDVGKSTHEVATKLTNPKKRFVKSFEDFELSQNAQKKSAYESMQAKQESDTVKLDTIKEQTSVEKKELAPQNDKQDKSETEKVDEQKEKFLEVSKLKTQLMSKLITKETREEKKHVKTLDAVEPNVTPKFREKYKTRMSLAESSKRQSFDSDDDKHLNQKQTVPDKKDVKESPTKSVPQEEKKELADIENKHETVQPTLTKNDIKGKSDQSALDIDSKLKEEPAVNENVVEAASKQIENNSVKNEDVSALSTLAAVSEELTVNKHVASESEVVAVDKNVTIVTEKELADGQVEFANASASNSKPLTLSSFSLDFSESTEYGFVPEEYSAKKVKSSRRSTDETKKESEKAKSEIKEGDKIEVASNVTMKPNEEPKDKVASVVNSAQSSGSLDLEAQIPPSVVCNTGTVESEMAKLTDTNPDQAETTPVPQLHQGTTSTKLLEILTDAKSKNTVEKKKHLLVVPRESPNKTQVEAPKILNRIDMKTPKYVVKSTAVKSSKPTILSEKIIKPVQSDAVSVSKVTSKRSYQDVEDIDAFIIQKPPKKLATSEADKLPTKKTPISKPAGKAKILQQTIITPAGDIIQPGTNETDDSMFDINSMPIVLSDQILTPESIDNMSIVLSDSSQAATKISEPVEKVITTAVKKPATQMKLLNKSAPVAVRGTPMKTQQTPTFIKTYAAAQNKGVKNQKVFQVASKVVKTNPAIISQQGKPGKFIIVPSSNTASGAKFNIEKRVPVNKRLSTPTASAVQKVKNVTPEPTGNKIMIVTNQQGQQSRVLLTPAQQKLLGYQTSGTKIKTTIKGATGQKNILGTKLASTSGIGAGKTLNIVTQQVGAAKTSQSLVTSTGQLLTPLTPQQLKTLKGETVSKTTKKIPMQTQRVLLSPMGTPRNTVIGPAKTPAIRAQQNVTTKKMPAVDEALLNKQVQEQLQAINKASAKQTPVRRYTKKQVISESPKNLQAASSKTQVIASPAVQAAPKTEASLPPLAPISPAKKVEAANNQTILNTTGTDAASSTQEKKPDRPLNQLIIQDGHGNQTTITEGQILALPSETVDGQPQSYMLVTLDETGNLTPLNNEALMSLDPNLGLGGDLSNMVLQIDSGNTLPIMQQPVAEPAETAVKTVVQEQALPVKENVPVEKPTPSLPVTAAAPQVATFVDEQAALLEKQQNVELNPETVTCTLNSDSNQQFIVTGDPIAAQKLIESLTEGSTDLANILASAENSSILIQADGQQILINADADNQMLLSVNADNLSVSDSSSVNNPIFAAQPSKSQDILAAALADTDVFQQDQNGQSLQSKAPTSQLSPNSTLYPMNVSNVLETSLTLSSPIMTPLEVPSTNNKKIDDETDILTQVPKNVDLPITITDPNISQTVSQQQVASLIASELQSNLDLPLSISEASMSIATSELNSPSYVYSLPSLDDSVDVGHKTFSSPISMPLLSEDSAESKVEADAQPKVTEEKEKIVEDTADNKEQTEASSAESEQITVKEPAALDDAMPKEAPEEVKATDETTNESEPDIRNPNSSFEEEGLCTLGGEMCSSLSEPPPDMFDLSLVNSSYISPDLRPSSDIPETTESVDTASSRNENPLPADNKNELFSMRTEADPCLEKFSPYDSKNNNSLDEGDLSRSNLSVDENSCEIPVQPDIVTDMASKPFELCESNQNASVKRDHNGEEETDAKRLKTD